MDTALIGLIGVVIGALLSGVFGFLLERKKSREQARTVGVLINTELHQAETSIHEVVAGFASTKTPRLSIATTRWQERGAALANEVSPDTWRTLNDTYTRIEALNQPDHPQDLRTLKQAEKAVWSAQREITDTLDAITYGAHRRIPPRFVGLIVVSSAVVALVLLLVLPSTTLTSTAIAGQLELALESSAQIDLTVDCDPDKDDWQCAVKRGDQQLFTCPVTLSRSNASCTERREERVQVIALEDEDLLRVDPAESDFTQKLRREQTTIESPKSRPFSGFWCWATGWLCPKAAPYPASR